MYSLHIGSTVSERLQVQPSVRKFRFASDRRVGQGTEVSLCQFYEQHPSLEPRSGLHRSRNPDDRTMESSAKLEEESSYLRRAVYRSDCLHCLGNDAGVAVYPSERSAVELHDPTGMDYG